MPRDSEATRKRILDAALLEFSEYGIAGARVDRIAANAKANKSLIYAYFGRKEELFLMVLKSASDEMVDFPRFERHDLPRFVGAFFDFLESHPHYHRLLLWEKLERVTFESSEELYRSLMAEVDRGQSEGIVNSEFKPEQVVALLSAIAGSWHNASPSLRSQATIEDLASRRQAAIRAAELVVYGTMAGE